MRDERPLLATPFDGNGCRRERGGGDKNVLPHILATEAATASQGSSAMRELGPVLEASLLAPGPGPMMSRDLPKKLPSSDQLSALACADPAVPVGGAKIKPVRTKSCYAFGSKSGGAGGSGGPEEGSDRSNVGGGNLFHNIKERLLDRSALLAKLFRR